MQKQRSPYTSGGLNVQQLKATTFGFNKKTEGLNSMPLLMQLAQHVQRPITTSTQSQPMQPGCFSAGHDRGQRSGAPRTYGLTEGNFNGSHEGDVPTMELAHNNLSNSDEESTHNMGQMSPERQVGQMGPIRKLSYMQKSQTASLNASYNRQSDTDSESEYSHHSKRFDIPEPTRWRSAYEFLKNRMSPQRQERMEAIWKGCHKSSIFNFVLLLMQLCSVVIGGLLVHSARLGYVLSYLGLRLGRCKFQVKGLLRQMLWRMANLKGNDSIVFIGIALATPWVFLISLVGLCLSVMFHFKEGLEFLLKYITP